MTWRLGRHVGGTLAGLIALALLASCPLYYGHMYMNAKDAPFAVAMVALALGLTRAIREYPAASPGTLVLVGAAAGFAIGTRILAGVAGLYVIVTLLFIFTSEFRRRGSREAATRAAAFVRSLAPALVLAYAVMALVWPWSVWDPLNPIKALRYFSHFIQDPWTEIFAGQLVSVGDMPRTYVPQLLALKIPEIMLMLGVAGTIAAILLIADGSTPVANRATLVLLALAAIIPVALAILTRPVMYNGLRHFVFIAPPFAVLGGLAGASCIAWLRTWTPTAPIVAAALIAAGCVQPAVEMARLHPYEYAYFNAASGGAQAARSRYMLDYWGLSFKQAAQALRANLAERNEVPTDGKSWRVAVCGPHYSAEIALRPDFVIASDFRDADFALMLGEFYCARLDHPLLADVARDGVVFSRIYDLRRQHEIQN
jgi:hypothetical protein